jgi:hypothetical protein
MGIVGNSDANRPAQITLPRNLAKKLEVGWIIACELKKTNSDRQIVDIDNVYPALTCD